METQPLSSKLKTHTYTLVPPEMQNSIWLRCVVWKDKHAKKESVWKHNRWATLQVHLHEGNGWSPDTHTHTLTQCVHYELWFPVYFPCYTTNNPALLAVVMFYWVKTRQGNITHTHTHTPRVSEWVIILINVAPALTQGGRMSCLSAIVELSVGSSHDPLALTTTTFTQSTLDTDFWYVRIFLLYRVLLSNYACFRGRPCWWLKKTNTD